MANFYGQYIGYGSGGGPTAELYNAEFFIYAQGGQQAGNQAYDRIDRWSVSADTNATDVGNLAQISMYNCGATSGTDGFCCTSAAAYPAVTGIQKYSYAAATTNASSHGDVVTANSGSHGHSDMSAQFGYKNGGHGANVNKQRFAFAANTTATNVGNLSTHHHQGGGSQDLTHGYSQSGYNQPENADITQIDRFAFASTVDSVDCGDVTVGRGGIDNAVSSTTKGYLVGGYSIGSGGYSNIIDSHTYASSITAADIGDLAQTNQGNGAAGSTDYGYAFGGQPPATLNNIWKFSYASGTQNGADIADLTLARVYVSGTQH